MYKKRKQAQESSKKQGVKSNRQIKYLKRDLNLKKNREQSHQKSPQSEYYRIGKNQITKNQQKYKSNLHFMSEQTEQQIYKAMHVKLDQLQIKMQQIKMNIHRKNIERMKKNVQRNQLLQETKRKKELQQLEQKQLQKKKQKDELNKVTQPIYFKNQQKRQQKISDRLIEENDLKIAHDSKLNEKESVQKNNYLSQFITQQKSQNSNIPYKQEETLHGLVTTVPQSHINHHIFETNPYSPRSSTYYVSEVVKGYKDRKSLVHEHVRSSIYLINYFGHMRMPNNEEVSKRKLKLPIKPGYENKKTIIFDLDETLIHCNESLSTQHQIELPITFPNGDVIRAGINIRPGAVQILQALHQKFQLMVFTASHNCYANVVIDYLDPKKQYIHHRLYREHCYLTPNGQYVKDLRIINRELKNMVLVDNAAYSYAFQMENGVPIIPYYHGSKDFQLKMLQKFLQRMEICKDVRTVNRSTFRLNRYRDYKHQEVEKLVEDLYINKID